MLHSTMEVITQATSNSLFVFLFCNLIIVILLVSSVKPGSGLDEYSSSHTLPVVANKKKKNGKYIIVEPSFKESKGLITVSEVSTAPIASIDDGNNNDNDNNSCNTDRNNNNNINSSGNSSNTATATSDNNNSSGKNTTTTTSGNNNNSSGKNTTTTTSGNNNNNNSSGNSSNTTTTSHNNNSSGKNTTTTSGNNNNSGNNDNNSSSNNDGDNDELRRKVEEFIEKVNRGWRAENLRTHSLVHIEKNPQPELTRIRAN